MGRTKLLSHRLLLKVQSELKYQGGREKKGNFEWSRSYEKNEKSEGCYKTKQTNKKQTK